MKMEENNKHVQPNSKEEGVQRLNRILSESLIKATDTYKTPPQIIWVDNSSINPFSFVSVAPLLYLEASDAISRATLNSRFCTRDSQAICALVLLSAYSCDSMNYFLRFLSQLLRPG